MARHMQSCQDIPRRTRSEFYWSEGAMATIQVIHNEKCAVFLNFECRFCFNFEDRFNLIGILTQ